MKLNRKVIATMLAVSMVTATAGSSAVTAEAASKPSVTKQLTITQGKKKTITVKGKFIKSKSFKSTNKSIAVVNKKGVVTAVSKGKCKVKVTVKYSKSKKAKKVLKKEFVTQITVKAKKKPEATKEPEVTQTPSVQATVAPETTPGTEATKDPSSNTEVTAAPQSSTAPEVTPAATPKATSAPTDTPKATTNPGVTTKPGTSQGYYPIPNVPKNTSKPTQTPTQAPDTPAGDKVENVVIDISEAASGAAATFTASSPAFINFSNLIDERFDLKYFSELQVGYTLKFVEESDRKSYNGGKIALASKIEADPEVKDDPDQLNGFGDGVAKQWLANLEEVGSTNPYNNVLTISLSDLPGGPAVGINVQAFNTDYTGWPDSLESITITSIKFVAKEGATYPAKPSEPTTTPSEPTTTPPTGPAVGASVEDVEIDVTQIGENEFNGNGAKINFSSQLNDLFDLEYFSELQVGYTLKFVEESDRKSYNGGKIALASKIEADPEVKDDPDQLNGFGDGVAKQWLANLEEVGSTNPYNNVLTISLSDLPGGPAVGINVQAFNTDYTGWPDSLESITITSIKFVAKEGATYEAK